MPEKSQSETGNGWGQETVNHLKVVVVGAPGVGKTSIVQVCDIISNIGDCQNGNCCYIYIYGHIYLWDVQTTYIHVLVYLNKVNKFILLSFCNIEMESRQQQEKVYFKGIYMMK